MDTIYNECMKFLRTVGNYSINKQIIFFTDHCQMKQYILIKPTRPTALKDFVNIINKSFIINLEIYHVQK